MFLYKYIYIYTYICKYIHACIHRYKSIYIYIYTYVYIYIHIYRYATVSDNTCHIISSQLKPIPFGHDTAANTDRGGKVFGTS